MNLAGAVILDLSGSILGESSKDLQTAIDAGVLYVCDRAPGECAIGNHRGGPFLHYCIGKTDQDYDAALEDNAR